MPDDKKDELPKFEDFLAPWERDKDGKKLDEPAEIDPVALKKHLYNLLSDKHRLQETVVDKDTEIAQAKDQLREAQTANENEEQRRTREAAEAKTASDEANAALLERANAADKLEVALAVPGISAERARVLAKRLLGKDEKAWKASASEIVEDGFRLVGKGEQQQTVEETDDDTDDLTAVPRARRSGGTPPPTPTDSKTDLQILNEAIPRRGW